LPATNAKRLREGAQATKQSLIPPERFWIVSLALAMMCATFANSSANAQNRIHVVTTTTDLRSLTEAVGGDLVEAISLVPPNFDAEEYQPKPQDALRLKEAVLVVRVGLDYDLWFDRLLQIAAMRELQRGGAGYVDASFGIAPLEVRGVAIGPGDGHAHGSGNPHYWLDPENAEFITANIAEGLARIDPTHASTFEANRKAFLSRLAAKLSEWQTRLAPLRSMPIIAYHNSWPYFARRFRLDFADFLEIKPGVPATPSHLAAIIDTMRSRGVRLVVREPHEPERDVAFVAGKTGASVVVLAASVGALPAAGDYLSLFDTDVAALLDAAGTK
jgi:ABC-type Zn uptake system ZnuABC Zn-binding protein ZnuA